jgi:hypothetical protein
MIGADANVGVAMMELTKQQVQALETPEAVPPRVVNPWSGETFVVLRQINKPSVATDRDAADRLDGTRDEFGQLANQPDDGQSA